MKKDKLYPWVVVGLLWVVGLLNYLDRQMLSTLRPAMQKDIGELASATNFGYLMGIFLWIYGLMSPVAGVIADRVNRKGLIVVSLLVWSGVVFTMGYATSYHELYVLRAIMGVSEALYLPAGLSLIADYHGNSTRGLAIGIHMTGLYLGQALGGFGGTIAAVRSWQSTFHLFGLAGIVYAGVLALLLRDKERRATSRPAMTGRGRSGLRGLLGLPAFGVILFYFAVLSLPGWAVKNWLPTLYSSSLGMEMAGAGPLATVTIACASFLGVVTGGLLSDRWIKTNVRGRVYTIAIGMGLTIPALLLLGFGHSLVMVVGAGICFGVGYGMTDANNMPLLCQFIGARQRATAYGLMNMVGVLSGALITEWLGKSTDAGHLGRDLSLLAVIVLAGLVLLVSFLRPGSKDYQDV